MRKHKHDGIEQAPVLLLNQQFVKFSLSLSLSPSVSLCFVFFCFDPQPPIISSRTNLVLSLQFVGSFSFSLSLSLSTRNPCNNVNCLHFVCISNSLLRRLQKLSTNLQYSQKQYFAIYSNLCFVALQNPSD